MSKKTVIALALPLLLILVISLVTPAWRVSAQPASQARSPQHAGSAVGTTPGTDTFQKMIVENGSVTMDLDLNGFNGSSSLLARPISLQFAVGANSFFPILVFNDLLRAAEPGSMALTPAWVDAP